MYCTVLSFLCVASVFAFLSHGVSGMIDYEADGTAPELMI
jgi:hypothetical protein